MSNIDPPKQPMSAYLAFANPRRAQLRVNEPYLTNAQLSQRLAQDWKEASEETKRKYQDEEKERRAQYQEKLKAWKEQQDTIPQAVPPITALPAASQPIQPLLQQIPILPLPSTNTMLEQLLQVPSIRQILGPMLESTPTNSNPVAQAPSLQPPSPSIDPSILSAIAATLPPAAASVQDAKPLASTPASASSTAIAPLVGPNLGQAAIQQPTLPLVVPDPISSNAATDQSVLSLLLQCPNLMAQALQPSRQPNFDATLVQLFLQQANAPSPQPAPLPPLPDPTPSQGPPQQDAREQQLVLELMLALQQAQSPAG